MAKQVKVLAAKAADLSSTPRNNVMKKGADSSEWFSHLYCGILANTHFDK